MRHSIRAFGLCVGVCLPIAAFAGGVGHWTELPTRNHATSEGQAVVLKDGRILQIGGFDHFYWDGGNPTRHCEIYDPRQPSLEWQDCDEMNEGRAMFWAAVLPSGNVLVAGTFERGDGPGPLTSEVYDPRKDRWYTVNSSPFDDQLGNPHSIMTAAVLDNGQVLIAGGGYGDGGGLTLTGASFLFTEDAKRPWNGQWTRTGDIPYAVVSAAYVKLTDGRVLIAGGFVGGYSGFGVSGAEAAVYDPADGTWTAVPDMPYSVGVDDSAVEAEPWFWGGPDCAPVGAPDFDPSCVGNRVNPGSRWFPAGVALPGGDALVTSGMSRGFDPDPEVGFFGYARKSAVRFDGATDTWSEVSPTAKWHAMGRAVPLPLGFVLLDGGHEVSAAEIYDPWHDRWYDGGGFSDLPTCRTADEGDECYVLDEFGGQLLRIDAFRVVQTCGYDYGTDDGTCDRAFLWSP